MSAAAEPARTRAARYTDADFEGASWWEMQALPCPRCDGLGRPIILEITTVDSRSAVRAGLACLGDCCIDGVGPERECDTCGLRF
jgi:hypothetical protein